MKLTEDDVYRASTQFRNWSFTSRQLAAQRLLTNAQAAERVRANVARQRAQRAQKVESDSSGATTPNVAPAETEVDCLTADEERKIVDDFCERSIKLGAHCGFPFDVTVRPSVNQRKPRRGGFADHVLQATCIQFFRRFYLFNSPMTYHVHNISRTIMFLAAKVEAHHLSIGKFADFFASSKGITPESILAPEYMVMQGLRYNLDVRHPFRALSGGSMEMMECAGGRYKGPGSDADVQAKMLQLPLKPNGPVGKMTVEGLEDRIQKATFYASRTLKEAALLTDAYFLYTPSHIWLAAFLLADEPLTLFYLGLKVPSSSPLSAKLILTIRNCAKVLSSHRLYINATLPKEESEAREAKHQAEVKRLINKLKTCRDPDKIDLVKLNQAQKRDALQGGELEESKAKRRKLERETYEKESDAFWGPELSQNGAKPS